MRRWAATLDRPLPWRCERDPYKILVSEVMLQQTQAARVVEPYNAFLARWPTVDALAAAKPADVLRQWGTLGYPRRAMYLWRTANAVVERGGTFPRTIDELRALPGIGPYTARAVASFAFDADAGVVEANVRRVITRFDGLPPDEDVQQLADEWCPPGESAVWNQAMIDLGAVVCMPRTPKCGECPLERGCAYAAGVVIEKVRKPAPRFETTMRYARGRVVDALRSRDMSVGELVVVTGLDAGRTNDAIESLRRDGLVTPRDDVVRLGT